MLSEVEIRICLLPDVDFRFDKLLDVELQNMSQFLEVEIWKCPLLDVDFQLKEISCHLWK